MLDLNLEYEGRAVRMVGTSDKPEWIAADVCGVLGIRDASMALRSLDPDEKGTTIVGTLGGEQEMLTVTEPGLYKLIARSRKPRAREFDRWVRHEVLPTIRQYGTYPKPDAIVKRDGTDEINLIHGGEIIARTILGIDEKMDAVLGNTEETNRRVEGIETRLGTLERNQHFQRKELTIDTKRRHVSCVGRLCGGWCPCCGRVQIVHDSEKTEDAQFEHFFSPTRPDFQDTWLTCADCNWRLWNDREFKDRKKSAFDHYQEKARHDDTDPSCVFGPAYANIGRKNPPKIRELVGQVYLPLENGKCQSPNRIAMRRRTPLSAGA